MPLLKEPPLWYGSHTAWRRVGLLYRLYPYPTTLGGCPDPVFGGLEAVFWGSGGVSGVSWGSPQDTPETPRNPRKPAQT